ncbi:MAG: prephenate dehydrogenase [Chloroflexi bacterium]|nr:prephenate dehydrogenase [Chloroflexota bacterium]
MTAPITICIVGLGLMGGSLALALRQASVTTAQQDAARITLHASRITGVSRRAETLAAALASGAVDAVTSDLAAGVADADVVVLATPGRTILRQLPQVGRHAKTGALILDLGSTKAEICAAMADLPAGLQPVGGHPMCGKEIAGFAAAEAGLFRDRPFVLCPLPRTAAAALEQARLLACAVGARPIVLDPATHDRAAAAISHLPYAVSVALVNAVAAADDPLAWSLAASGFRDTSRLAASDVEMMLDILLTNREAVLDWLDAFAGQLAALRAALSAHDEDALRSQLTAAQARRTGMKF